MNTVATNTLKPQKEKLPFPAAAIALLAYLMLRLLTIFSGEIQWMIHNAMTSDVSYTPEQILSELWWALESYLRIDSLDFWFFTGILVAITVILMLRKSNPVLTICLGLWGILEAFWFIEYLIQIVPYVVRSDWSTIIGHTSGAAVDLGVFSALLLLCGMALNTWIPSRCFSWTSKLWFVPAIICFFLYGVNMLCYIIVYLVPRYSQYYPNFEDILFELYRILQSIVLLTLYYIAILLLGYWLKRVAAIRFPKAAKAPLQAEGFEAAVSPASTDDMPNANTETDKSKTLPVPIPVAPAPAKTPEPKTVPPAPVKTPAQPVIIRQARYSAAEEIKKYKELLDSGAITQAEYDAKKRQLLGL